MSLKRRMPKRACLRWIRIDLVHMACYSPDLVSAVVMACQMEVLVFAHIYHPLPKRAKASLKVRGAPPSPECPPGLSSYWRLRRERCREAIPSWIAPCNYLRFVGVWPGATISPTNLGIHRSTGNLSIRYYSATIASSFL